MARVAHTERLPATGEGTRAGPFGAAEWGLLAATALMWGSGYLFVAIGLESLSPGAVTFLRVVLGTALLACVPAARHAGIAPADRPRLLLLGVLWLALPLTLFPIAQQWVSSAVAGMITGAQPIFAAAIAALLLRRAPGLRQLAGMALGFAGVVAIAWSAAAGGKGGSTAAGMALVLVAVACYALAANLAVPLQQRYGSLPVILRALAVALVLTAPLGAIGLADSSPSARSLAAMLPLGLLATGAGYVAFATLVGRAGASRGAVAIYFVPVVALALGVALQGDEVGPLALAGTAVVVAGAWATGGARRAART